MYYYDELSVNEIAAEMGVSRGTILSRLSYARKKLKKNLEEYITQGYKLYGLSGVQLLAYLRYFLQKDAQSDKIRRLILLWISSPGFQTEALLTASIGASVISLTSPVTTILTGVSAVVTSTMGKVAIAAIGIAATAGIAYGMGILGPSSNQKASFHNEPLGLAISAPEEEIKESDSLFRNTNISEVTSYEKPSPPTSPNTQDFETFYAELPSTSPSQESIDESSSGDNQDSAYPDNNNMRSAETSQVIADYNSASDIDALTPPPSAEDSTGSAAAEITNSNITSGPFTEENYSLGQDGSASSLPDNSTTSTDTSSSDNSQDDSSEESEHQHRTMFGTSIPDDPVVATNYHSALCSLCGEYYLAPHILNKTSFSVLQSATCLEPGIRLVQQVCSSCGYVSEAWEEEIPALGHNYEEVTTTDETGTTVTIIRCTRCDLEE